MKKSTHNSLIIRYLFICSIFFLYMNADGQILKGTSVLTGDLNTSYQTRENSYGTNKYLDFSLSPSFGVFLGQNFSLNLALGAAYSSSTLPQSTGESKGETLSYFFNPYLDFYKTITDKFYFNMEFYFGYQMNNEKSTYNSVETKTNSNTIDIGFQPGFTYFLTDRVAMKTKLGSIGYSLTTEQESKYKTSQFNTIFGFNALYIGFSFYMTKKI